jgi:hypothetical protein
LSASKVDKFVTIVDFQSNGVVSTRNATCEAITLFQSACRLPSTASVVRFPCSVARRCVVDIKFRSLLQIFYGGTGVMDADCYHVFDSGYAVFLLVTCPTHSFLCWTLATCHPVDSTSHTVKKTCTGQPPAFPLTRHSASCSRSTMVVFGSVLFPPRLCAIRIAIAFVFMTVASKVR